jgi:hypothetical protein
MRCSGMTPQTCNGSGQWQNSPLMQGACGTSCTPGETTCLGTTAQRCSSAGTYQNLGVSGGQCGAECTPNDSLCAGSAGECPLLSPTCETQSAEPNVVYKKVCDSTGHWTKQYCTTPCKVMQGSGNVSDVYSCKLDLLFDAVCAC